MELKDILALASCILLVLSGSIYGVKFLRKGNYLLGLEWLIVAFSGTNFVVYMLSGWKVSYAISFFCDAFSRGFGIPVVTVLGLMAVTHRYKPSLISDVLIFAFSFAATFVLVLADFVKGPLPYFYVVMWVGFSGYLLLFIGRLVKEGALMHAVGVSIAMLLGLAVALIYDFFPIPGDETQAWFMTLALSTWAYLMMQLYYSYLVLQRNELRFTS